MNNEIIMSANPIKDSSLSPWAPLHHRVFRMLWIASIVSNIGSWMHARSAQAG
ncbi:MAG: MFS transporter [Gallionellaceae bacterium]